MDSTLQSLTLDDQDVAIPKRLWVYTNFDCNLKCSYCLSSSSPTASRREIPLETYQVLISEAVDEGIENVFLTGGEPFLLPDIHERVEYALQRASVTVLTNGLLLKNERLKRLREFRHKRLTLQVSLDGHLPELHEAYRGAGTWRSTIDSIERLLGDGFNVGIGATATPANEAYETDLRRFVAGLGIPEEQFFMRPLTRTGLSQEGLVLSPEAVIPELTVTVDGVFWHPQAGGTAHLLSRSFTPLRHAIELMQATYHRLLAGGPRPQTYRCA